MLKKKAFKKILLSLSFLLIILIVHIFPDKNEEVNSITKTDDKINIIYLLDNNNYIARVNTILTSNNTIDRVKEIISILTIDSNKYIREGFTKIIPKNTKLIDCSLNDKLLKLNFSKELLNVDINNEEKMIEAIVYSMTNLADIEYVSIYVEGNILTNLPNSKKKLNTILDRKMGINKEFNINSINNTTKTTIYYLSKYKDYYYYVPVTKINNDNDLTKIEIIIKELTSSKMLNTNLISYLNNKTELLSYNETDNTLLLNFNDSILDLDTNNILEKVTYSINLSIKDNYDVKSVLYYVNDKIISTFAIN